MTQLERHSISLFKFLLGFYPKSVRNEFSEEMRDVFSARCHTAAQHSILALLNVVLKEIVDFPGVLIELHLHQLRASMIERSRLLIAYTSANHNSREAVMLKDTFEAVSRKKAITGALPLLLLGMGITFAALIRTDVWYNLPKWQLYLSAGVALTFGVIVGVGGIIAFAKGIPTWGLTWVGCTLMGATLFVQVFVSEGLEEGWLSLSPTLELILALIFFIAGFLLLIFIANRGWAQGGLFTIAVAATLGLSLFQSLTAAPFNRDDLAILAGPLSLLMCILIYFYLREPGGKRIVILVTVALTNLAIVWIASSAWESWFENRGAASPLLPLLIIVSGLLVSGPLFALVLEPIKRMTGWSRPSD
jgi:hypothetical protein